MVKVRINRAKLERALRQDLVRTGKELKKALNAYGFAFQADMDARFGQQLTGGRNPSGRALAGRLATRTGALKGSVGHVIRGKGRDLQLFLFIGDAETGKYAGIQEHGGVIRGSPWLTVPLPDNLTGTGRTRFASARATPNSFITRGPSGSLLIGSKAEGGEVKWMWVLKRSVKIPPRLGFEKTFMKSIPDLNKRLNAAVDRALRKGA